MNDMTVSRVGALMRQAFDLSISDKVWKCEPLGMTQFQISKFVLNNKDFPTPDLKYRQAILEVWARWGAWRSAKYQYDKLEAQIGIWEAERQELIGSVGQIATRSFLPLFRRSVPSTQQKRIDAQVKMLDIEIANAHAQRKELELDMQYRIIRETEGFMEALKQYAPAEGDRMKVELDNWMEKAKRNPKVKDLMEGI